MKQTVLVTGMVPIEGLTALYEHFDVLYAGDGAAYSREDVLDLLPQADGVLLMAEKADKEFLDRCGRVKVIAVNGVGYDHVDLAYAKEKGVAVCNSPQAVIEPTAELAMTLLLSAARRIGFYDENIRNGIWNNISYKPEQAMCLYGATLGVVGMGRIGRAVARRAMAFGMKIVYFEQCDIPAGVLGDIQAERVSFEELLRRSDAVTIHAPLLETTRHLFSDKEFAAMKNTAVIVNAARGPIIDEAALVRALKAGQIAGAGLDVFEFEPKVTQELLEMRNVAMTPHAGTGCVSSRRILAEESSANIIACLAEGKPSNVVNR